MSHGKNMEFSSSSSKGVFMLVHSEQKQQEDNFDSRCWLWGGDYLPSISLPSGFLSWQTENVLEFVFHQKMKTLCVKLPIGEAKGQVAAGKAAPPVRRCCGPLHLTSRAALCRHLTACKVSETLSVQTEEKWDSSCEVTQGGYCPFVGKNSRIPSS